MLGVNGVLKIIVPIQEQENVIIPNLVVVVHAMEIALKMSTDAMVSQVRKRINLNLTLIVMGLDCANTFFIQLFLHKEG